MCFFAVSLNFGSFKMVKILIQVVYPGCFPCFDSFLVVCLFVSGCFPLSLIDLECVRWFSVVLYLV